MDVCTQLEWNPMAAGSTLSAYAGVAGSLTLTVIVILLGQPNLAETRIGALLLFTVALFEMGVSCVMFAAVVGEANCLRGYVEVLIAAPPLSIGTVQIMAGVAWLFDVLDCDSDLEQVSRLLVYAVVITAAGLHATLVWSFFDDLVTVRAWTGPRLSSAGALTAIGAAAAIVLTIGYLRPVEQTSRNTALRHAAYISVGLTMAQVGLLAVVHVLPHSYWQPPLQPWIVHVAATFSLATPVFTSTAIVRALPRYRPPMPY
ncbi:hypothetical protein [Nonomuraea endophytica]|uniref:hypothetical protein n=1 Tax=Nonomuraea endophytica TaxID=714136 RepID=UPI0037CA56C4